MIHGVAGLRILKIRRGARSAGCTLIMRIPPPLPSGKSEGIAHRIGGLWLEILRGPVDQKLSTKRFSFSFH